MCERRLRGMHLKVNSVLTRSTRVLDIGCGIGTLVVLMKRQLPSIEAVGLDPDPKAPARERHRRERTLPSLGGSQAMTRRFSHRGDECTLKHHA